MLKRSLFPAPSLLPNGEQAPSPPLSIAAVMAAGGTAGVAMWSVAIPPDVSQTRVLGLTADDQISIAIRSPGHLLWFFRLCEEVDSGRRYHCALERVRSRDGQSFPGQCRDVCRRRGQSQTHGRLVVEYMYYIGVRMAQFGSLAGVFRESDFLFLTVDGVSNSSTSTALRGVAALSPVIDFRFVLRLALAAS